MRNHHLILLFAGLTAGCAADDLVIGELEQELVESDSLHAPAPAAHGSFGISVELDGDCLAVGSLGAPGTRAVQLYRAQPSWTLEASLPESPASDDDTQFGMSLALDGDRLAVGARDENVRYLVRIYDRVAGAWTQSATIEGPPGGVAFSPRLALEGDHLLVGSFDGGYPSDAGAVFAYVRAAGGAWTLTQVLHSPSSADSYFGLRVAISNGRLLVAPYQHRAYTYVTGRAGLWTQEAVLSTGLSRVVAVALDGDVAMIAHEVPVTTSYGKREVRVFKRINGGWNDIQGFSLGSVMSGWFTAAIDIDGMNALVGVPHAACGKAGAAGCAYRLRAATWTRSTWGLVDALVASDGTAGDSLGYDVALSGPRAVAGAPGAGAYEAAGAVYLFDL